MKIDLSKNGFESLFTPWQTEIVYMLTENPGREWTSGVLHTEMFDREPVSRASVIGFMKLLEAWGIVVVSYDKAQGGEYRIYIIPHTEESLREYFASLAESWAKEMRNPSSTSSGKKEEKECIK